MFFFKLPLLGVIKQKWYEFVLPLYVSLTVKGLIHSFQSTVILKRYKVDEFVVAADAKKRNLCDNTRGSIVAITIRIVRAASRSALTGAHKFDRNYDGPETMWGKLLHVDGEANVVSRRALLYSRRSSNAVTSAGRCDWRMEMRPWHAAPYSRERALCNAFLYFARSDSRRARLCLARQRRAVHESAPAGVFHRYTRTLASERSMPDSPR